jgi:hypothetical protein
MKTFLQVLLCVLLALVAIKLLPFVLFPALIGGGALLLIAGLAFGGVVTVAGLGVAAVATLLAVVIALIAALSPIWVPVLAVVGIVALIRRSNRTAA